MKRLFLVIAALVGLAGSAYADCACTKDKCACVKKVCENGQCRLVHDCKCPTTDNCKQVCQKCAPSPKATGSIDEPSEQVWKYYQSSVRVAGCSGTVIDCYENDKGKYVCFVLSCWHIVDNNPKSVKIETFWPKKEAFTGYILSSDRSNDLSLLIFQSDHPVAYTPLAVNETLNQNDRITSIGCPNSVDPVGYHATVTDLNGKSDMAFSRNSPRYYYNSPSIGGHSGGGVFKNDLTVGVLVATFGSNSEAVTTPVCRNFYENAIKSKVPTCLFRWLFGRRHGGSQPGYQGPPATVQPDISLTPKPVDPPPAVPEQPAVVEVPAVPENPENLFHLPAIVAAVSGAGAAVVEWLKRTRV